MSNSTLELDEERTAALQAAVSAGGAPSVQAAVESALDAWLSERALERLSDEDVRRLWQEGLASGDAGALDFALLKAEARGAAGLP